VQRCSPAPEPLEGCLVSRPRATVGKLACACEARVPRRREHAANLDARGTQALDDLLVAVSRCVSFLRVAANCGESCTAGVTVDDIANLSSGYSEAFRDIFHSGARIDQFEGPII